MRKGAALLSLLLLTGCTTAQLARSTADATWSFTSDYASVSDCLVRALNKEWQPKTSAGAFFGRSIGHHVVTVEPGQINHVTHEHAGPSTGWLFVVSSQGPNETRASAHFVKNLVDHGGKMRRAASSCGGKEVL